VNPLHELSGLGQAVWLDAIRRSYLDPGGFLPTLIDDGEIQGLTSNPTIFAKAMSSDRSYAQQISELAGADAREAFWTLAKEDVRRACDLFLPLYEDSDGLHGQVSIEVDPAKAFDTEETVSEGLLLYSELDRPNLMIKVPGTEPGLPAVTRLLAEGVNVNVTLLFSVSRYEKVIEAFLDGLRRRAESGGDLRRLSSVASFFVSRVDNKVDAILPEGHPLRGTAAIDNARAAYASFERLLRGDAFTDLAEAGARVQRPLWASTSTKNPAYQDTMYVDALAGPDTVNTMPEVTLEATRDHGDVADRLSGSGQAALERLGRLRDEGVDLDQVTKELESEGVSAFVDSFEEAVATVGEQIG
jgi:transaldolase